MKNTTMQKAQKLFEGKKKSYYIKSGKQAISVMWKLLELFNGGVRSNFPYTEIKHGRCLLGICHDNDSFSGEWEADTKTLTIVKHTKKSRFTPKEQLYIDKLIVLDNPERVFNSFSGESVELEPVAVAIYDYIKGCELFGKWSEVRKGLDIFRKYWPSEYMILLD